MEERPENSVDAVKTGTSRRTALKLGAGAGVGMVAWSGMSITSLGGTPVYAAGCTGVVSVTLDACNATTQQTGFEFSYQPLSLAGLPPDYSFDANIPNNTGCGTFSNTLTFPAGVECTVTIAFNAPPNCTGTSVGELSFTSATGTLVVDYDCLNLADPPGFKQSTQRNITLNCASIGAPADCFD